MFLGFYGHIYKAKGEMYKIKKILKKGNILERS